MLKAAGMHVTINGWATLTAAIAGFDTHKWQVNLWGIGAYDPAGGAALDFFLKGSGPFSGINDPTVNSYISVGASSSSPSVRATAYKHLGDYLNQKALMPFICTPRAGTLPPRASAPPGSRLATGATSADRWSGGRPRRSTTASPSTKQLTRGLPNG